MTQFNWIILGLPCYPQEARQSDVVFQVNWQCQAISDSGAANAYGSVPVIYTAGFPFTPYADLTQEQVWGWINPSIDRPAVEANLQTMIDSQKNPPVITLSLPWNN
jgi:hypothetical protein